MNLICNKEESDARSNYWRHCRFCLRMEQYQNEDFPLFRKDCFFTDDTVMTCAVAEAIMNGGQKDDFIDAMKKYGRLYPNADYGARFNAWLNSDSREPYNSFGMVRLCVFLHVHGHGLWFVCDSWYVVVI